MYRKPRPLSAYAPFYGYRPELLFTVSPDDQGGAGGGGTGGQAGDKGKETENSQQVADKGFPADTPVAEMSPAQQAAYWKDKSDRYQAGLRNRGDYDDLKKKAEQYDEQQKAALSQHEKDLAAAVEKAKKEGRDEVRRESNLNSVRAIFESGLKARDKSDDMVEGYLKHLNLESFVTDDGKPDVTAIHAHVKVLAGDPKGGGRGPDFGGGRRGPGSNTSRAADGLSEAEKRFGKKTAE